MSLQDSINFQEVDIMLTKERIKEIWDEVDKRWDKLSWIEKTPVEERYKE